MAIRSNDTGRMYVYTVHCARAVGSLNVFTLHVMCNSKCGGVCDGNGCDDASKLLLDDNLVALMTQTDKSEKFLRRYASIQRALNAHTTAHHRMEQNCQRMCNCESRNKNISISEQATRDCDIELWFDFPDLI